MGGAVNFSWVVEVDQVMVGNRTPLQKLINIIRHLCNTSRISLPAKALMASMVIDKTSVQACPKSGPRIKFYVRPVALFELMKLNTASGPPFPCSTVSYASMLEAARSTLHAPQERNK